MPPFWVLAALAAVAYMLWSRPAVAPSLPQLPPLSPIAPPGLAPLRAQGAAAGGGGPHPFTLVAILAAGAMVAFAVRESRPPAPAPTPPLAVGLDLRGTFVGQEASADAAVTSALLGELADCLEQDAVPKASGAEPRLRTGAQFDDLRKTARELRCRGVSLGQKHPVARDAIAKFLDGAVGTDGGPVDAAGRARWVAAYREVSRAAAVAAGVTR